MTHVHISGMMFGGFVALAADNPVALLGFDFTKAHYRFSIIVTVTYATVQISQEIAPPGVQAVSSTIWIIPTKLLGKMFLLSGFLGFVHFGLIWSVIAMLGMEPRTL